MFDGLLRSMRASVLEARAFAKQAVLLPRDIDQPVIPRDVAPSEHVVVVLHGLFASAGVLRPLRARIDRHEGLRTATISYAPHRSVREVGDMVRRIVAELPSEAAIHLVGHSLGGIVARWFAVTVDDPRVVQTVALASPFGGVRATRILAMDLTRDLDPDGEVLRTIRTRRLARPIPHLSIVAGSDVLFKDPVVHALADGDVAVLRDRGHNALLFDEECLDMVEARIRAHASR
jgi:pimeloyl-ACP methyl ester carboxylesterase